MGMPEKVRKIKTEEILEKLMSNPPMFEEKHKYLYRQPQQIPNRINSKRSETLYNQTTERQRDKERILKVSTEKPLSSTSNYQ